MDWLGPVIGFVVGVISTIVTERLNLWLNRPGIRIKFQADEHCLRFSNAHVNDGIRAFMTESKFLRVRIENHRRHLARGCRCLITSIKRTVSSGDAKLILSDTLPLRWAYLGFDPIDIPSGAYFYADIISALQNDQNFKVELGVQPLLLQHATTEAGLYTIEVAIVGENFDPQRIRLFLNWKGDWDFEDVWAEPANSQNTI